MVITRLGIWMCSVGVMLLGTNAACGQDYPSKPIRIVTGGLGGGDDFTARLMGPPLSSRLGQPVVVDNRGGNTSGEVVAKAPPDGYIILLADGPFFIGPMLRKMPYDPVRDFSPVTLVSTEPQLLVVHPSLPVKSVQELIALAKARPGELNYASGQTGGANHLAAELFKSMARVNIVRVNYKSPAQALSDLVGGHVQLRWVSATGGMPYVKSGKLRPLGVTSAQPSAVFPGLPTVATAVPGYESTGSSGIWVPVKTPAAIIKRLNQEIVQVLNQPDVKPRLAELGVDVVGNSPEEFATWLRATMARLDKLIKDAGITGD